MVPEVHAVISQYIIISLNAVTVRKCLLLHDPFGAKGSIAASISKRLIWLYFGVPNCSKIFVKMIQ